MDIYIAAEICEQHLLNDKLIGMTGVLGLENETITHFNNENEAVRDGKGYLFTYIRKNGNVKLLPI